MSSLEKFCLKWNDFSDNLHSTFSGLRSDDCFVDVTLVCEDETQIGAHKLVLSAGSMFFKNLLKNKTREVPIIYMRGLKSPDLSAILDFLYHGEVSVRQEDLDNFLALAEELHIKGLVGGDIKRNNFKGKVQMQNDATKQVIKVEPEIENGFEQITQEEYEAVDKSIPLNSGENYIQHRQIGKITIDNDLKQKMYDLIEQNGENWSCKICGKVANTTAQNWLGNLKRHSQIHMEGVSYPCNICGKEYRCSNNLTTHMYRTHKSA